ncbi:MAG: hypothetical protein JRI97_06010 [Deltaproteobacteria bacterium]|nr:hypothetical protein [Deltaproteobacteria bacterium]
MRNRLPVLAAVLLLAAALFASCGRKAPPVPPGAPVPAAVCGLSATVENGRAVITFSGEPCGEGARAERFLVFRCRRRLQAQPCPECPCPYSLAGSLDNPRPGGQPARLTYAEDLKPGYAYRYKVVPVGEAGVRGAESRVMSLPFPGAAPEPDAS